MRNKMSVGVSSLYPIYCPDCRRSNTFIRKENRDVKYTSGEVFEEAWICKCCSYIAYRNSCLAIFRK